jgi:ribosomal protein S18 acetylase RimI-like enzyme
VRELEPRELDRMRALDRSEVARFVYVREGDELRPVEADLEIPTWDEAAVAEATARLAPKLAAGGVLLGAFDGDRLVGVAVLGGERIGTRANRLELAFLHVNAGDRRRGVARKLADELCRRARGRGAEQLYVSASDTESAIRFYLRHGWRPAEHVEPAIVAENAPTDIQLVLDL